MFKKTKNPKLYTGAQNPRTYSTMRYWTVLVCTFFILLTAALLFSSWLFIHTTESLDAEALATFENNSARIRGIEADIAEAERAIRERTGEEEIIAENQVIAE
ncbi:MAG TPA: hypothetical protein VGE18_03565 [Candidatus Paceibacterota bacterium]